MITVGITGHRFLAELEKVTRGLDLALERIEQSYPGEEWTIISPLAEGSDQVFVLRVLKRRDARLLVPLPVPQQEYLRTFDSVEAQQEFLRLLDEADKIQVLSPCATLNEAYVRVGEFVVEQSSVLIAIWDGQPAQGQGGTSHVVALARARQLPIAWVHAGNRLPGNNQPISLGEMQGRVSFENFPGE